MHTPGPWRVEQSTRTDQHIIAGNRWIATASNHDFHPTAEENERTRANARLIAAAPALLTALAELVGALEADAMDDKSNVYRSMMLSANHAIALATED